MQSYNEQIFVFNTIKGTIYGIFLMYIRQPMHAINFKLRAKRKNENEERKNLNKIKNYFGFP